MKSDRNVKSKHSLRTNKKHSTLNTHASGLNSLKEQELMARVLCVTNMLNQYKAIMLHV